MSYVDRIIEEDSTVDLGGKTGGFKFKGFFNQVYKLSKNLQIPMKVVNFLTNTWVICIITILGLGLVYRGYNGYYYPKPSKILVSSGSLFRYDGCIENTSRCIPTRLAVSFNLKAEDLKIGESFTMFDDENEEYTIVKIDPYTLNVKIVDK